MATQGKEQYSKEPKQILQMVWSAGKRVWVRRGWLFRFWLVDIVMQVR